MPERANTEDTIKRAARELDCVDISAEEFVRFFEANLKARGKTSYSPLDTLTCLIEEAISRQTGARHCGNSKFPEFVGISWRIAHL